MAGLQTWLSVPYHWSFIVIGVIAGAGTFLGLKKWFDPKDGVTRDDIEELKRLILGKIPQQENTDASQIDSYLKAAGELIESGDLDDLAIAREIAEEGPEAAGEALMEEVRSGKKRNAERARQAGRIFAPFAPSKARDAYEEAVDLDPTDVWSWIELGRLRAVYDNLQRARNCFGSALQHVSNERDRMVLHNEFGNILIAEGALTEAVKEYEAALAIAEKLAAAEPANAEWQRDLSVSYNRLGDVEVAAGNLAAARDRFEKGLDIREKLAAAEPANAEWQRDLFVSRMKLVQLSAAQEDGKALIQHLQSAGEIITALHQQWPDHPQFGQDYENVQTLLGQLETAIKNENDDAKGDDRA